MYITYSFIARYFFSFICAGNQEATWQPQPRGGQDVGASYGWTARPWRDWYDRQSNRADADDAQQGGRIPTPRTRVPSNSGHDVNRRGAGSPTGDGASLGDFSGSTGSGFRSHRSTSETARHWPTGRAAATANPAPGRRGGWQGRIGRLAWRAPPRLKPRHSGHSNPAVLRRPLATVAAPRPHARNPPVRTWRRFRSEADARPRTRIVFRSPGVGIGKDAHHDPTRPHEQHAIVRHDVSIAPGLRHAGGDLIGHRVQLDPERLCRPAAPSFSAWGPSRVRAWPSTQFRRKSWLAETSWHMCARTSPSGSRTPLSRVSIWPRNWPSQHFSLRASIPGTMARRGVSTSRSRRVVTSVIRSGLDATRRRGARVAHSTQLAGCRDAGCSMEQRHAPARYLCET